MTTKLDLEKEIVKLNKRLSKDRDTIKELKKQNTILEKSENNAGALKTEILLLRKLNVEFKAMAEKAGSECAKYRHELERMK